MLRTIDDFLNKFTMYRFLVYYLGAILAGALVLSLFHLIPVQPIAILSTTAIYIVVTYLANLVFSRLLKVHSNPESTLITALILSLISGPVSIFSDPRKAAIFALAGLVAIASKYLIAIRKQHIFNPAAFGIFISDIVFGLYSSWWVGNIWLLPIVAVGGVLLLRKINRFRFVASFFAAFVVFLMALSIIQGLPFSMALQNVAYVFLHTELLFFAFIMLTEPITSPKRFSMQLVYNVAVAFLFQPQLTIGGMNFTPEEALLIGNLFSYIISPNFKLALELKDRREIGNGILAFSFDYPKGFSHELGQFMEWTLPLSGMDSRGNRRYFSIASSPTEAELLIAARFYPRSSSYKQRLSDMKRGDEIIAAELSGDFVLPKKSDTPLLFIAGGIGITPFRSMIKYLTDTGEHRDIVLLYSNRSNDQIVFKDVFDAAQSTIGLKVAYTLTDAASAPEGWDGSVGPIDAAMIEKEVPDYRRRKVFISGSPSMVEDMKQLMRVSGVNRSNVRSDYFPGY